jgi:hypothetical protein
VNPLRLRLPPGRQAGADLIKLARQLQQFGSSMAGMPPVQVTRGAGGELMINDGVTRAVRVAKRCPGATISVEIIEDRPGVDLSQLKSVEESL